MAIVHAPSPYVGPSSHPHPTRTPRRAASPYARSASAGSHPHSRPKGLPLSLSIALNVPLRAVGVDQVASAADFTCSSPLAGGSPSPTRIRRHTTAAKLESHLAVTSPTPSPSLRSYSASNSDSADSDSNSNSNYTSFAASPTTTNSNLPTPGLSTPSSTDSPTFTPGLQSPTSPTLSPIAFSYPRAGQNRRRFPTARSPPSFSLITPHLAIADLAFAESADLLERAGVTHVVSVLGERAQIPSSIPPSHCLHVPLDDAPFAELVGALGPVVTWVRGVMREAGVFGAGSCAFGSHEASCCAHDAAFHDGAESGEKPKPIRILIHCAHGISRSPAVGAALLVALPLVDDVPLLDSPAAAEMDVDEDAEMDGAQWTTSPVALSSSPASSYADLPPPSASLPATSASSSPLPLTSTTASSLGNADAPPPRPVRRTLSAPAALAYVAARRPAADVNWGFRAQLSEWEGTIDAKDGTTTGTTGGTTSTTGEVN
ncbi:hypothetical protein B0H16DRAFT_1454135 [Mycena metata]|uniref:Uncharacterized protein n=1 Tax=Mycena metata TaxID=1033252 RepID=A0AAD7NLK1_9AGAR|nr:hypothetical protein B0H16DRAFT_1454135 [Mycena metata]